MTIDAPAFLILSSVALLSAATQGFTGFGFGLVGMAFCTWLLGPRNANVLWSMLAVVLTAIMWARLRADARLGVALCLAAGGLLGLPAGVWILANADERLLSRFVGAAILLFATYSLLNPRFHRRGISPAWGVSAGALGGFFSGATTMGGPAVVIFLLLLGLGKDGIKGTLAAYFTLMTLCKLAIMGGWHGLITPAHLVWTAALCAPMVGGMVGGMYGSRFLSSDTMRKVICALLLLPGAMLLLR